MPFASLQCSLQYLPNSPLVSTVQTHPGCAHCSGWGMLAPLDRALQGAVNALQFPLPRILARGPWRSNSA